MIRSLLWLIMLTEGCTDDRKALGRSVEEGEAARLGVRAKVGCLIGARDGVHLGQCKRLCLQGFAEPTTKVHALSEVLRVAM